jgi:hypothetical protein
METGIDCGGPVCMPCGDGLGCMVDGDCQSGICLATKCAAIEVWAQAFGDQSTPVQAEQPTAVATDGADNVLLTGNYVGSLNFGGPTLQGGASYLVKFDPAGKYLWDQTNLPPNYGAVAAMTADGQGNVYLTGYFGGTPPFGSGASGCYLPAPTNTFGMFVRRQAQRHGGYTVV